LKTSHLTTLAGILWVAIGTFLIVRGVAMYRLAVLEQHATQTALVFSVVVGVCLGSAKGLFVLSRTAQKNKTRIENLPHPIHAHHIFSKPFYGLIAGMMLLGFLLRTWNEYLGGYIVVAAIYCGIGMALLLGSRVYWLNRGEAPGQETP
jgi:hypothetical protein